MVRDVRDETHILITVIIKNPIETLKSQRLKRMAQMARMGEDHLLLGQQ